MLEKFHILQVAEKTSQNEIFKSRFNAILRKNVSVENIETYADAVLDELIELTEEVTTSYKSIVEPADKPSNTELENAAYTYFDLLSIGDALICAQEVQQSIANIEARLAEVAVQKKDIYLIPPGSRPVGLGNGESEFKAKEIIPRIKMLLYLLESDCDIDLEEIVVTPGEVDERWFREEPYYRIEIPSLERVVYVCEEEGNASYIFDTGLLNEIGIDLNLLDHTAKEDLNAVITELPGIGMRVIQQPGWREVMNTYLLAPMQVEERSAEYIEQETDYVVASVDDLDPWKGFYTDENGKHWGSATVIAKKINLDTSNAHKLLVASTLPTRPMRGHKNLIAYCLEDVLEYEPFNQRLSKDFTAETDGEWAGFYTDENGKHWGSALVLGEKLGLHYASIINIAKRNSWPSIKFKNRAGQFSEAYCYEDSLVAPDVTRLVNTPFAETQGEWKGFYTDENGKHWASKNILAVKLGVSKTFLSFLQDVNIQTRTIRNPNPAQAYCYEDVLSLPEMIQFTSLPQVQMEGEWKGFYIDKEGKHWGGLMAINAKVHAESLERLQRYLETTSLQTMQLRNPASNNAYCLEEVIDSIKNGNK